MVIPFHFVLSAPRSGSTWLAKALNVHPEIFATEHRLFGDFCEIWPNNDGSKSPRITFDAYAKAVGVHYLFEELGVSRPEFLDAFQKSYINFLSAFASRRTGKRVLVDKVTPYLGTCQTVLDQINRLLPESQVIHLIRDGRDVLTSGTFDWLQREDPDSPRYQYLIAKSSDTPPSRFFDDRVIDQWAEHWREVCATAESASLATTVKYEAMKQDHAGQLRKLFQILGVSESEDVAQACAEATTFEKATGRAAGDQRKTDKARKGISGDWKNYFTQRDGIRFREIAGQQLINYGYEQDHSWVDSLPTTLRWTNDLIR